VAGLLLQAPGVHRSLQAQLPEGGPEEGRPAGTRFEECHVRVRAKDPEGNGWQAAARSDLKQGLACGYQTVECEGVREMLGHQRVHRPGAGQVDSTIPEKQELEKTRETVDLFGRDGTPERPGHGLDRFSKWLGLHRASMRRKQTGNSLRRQVARGAGTAPQGAAGRTVIT